VWSLRYFIVNRKRKIIENIGRVKDFGVFLALNTRRHQQFKHIATADADRK
jgi:hypothetical protein